MSSTSELYIWMEWWCKKQKKIQKKKKKKLRRSNSEQVEGWENPSRKNLCAGAGGGHTLGSEGKAPKKHLWLSSSLHCLSSGMYHFSPPSGRWVSGGRRRPTSLKHLGLLHRLPLGQSLSAKEQMRAWWARSATWESRAMLTLAVLGLKQCKLDTRLKLSENFRQMMGERENHLTRWLDFME